MAMGGYCSDDDCYCYDDDGDGENSNDGEFTFDEYESLSQSVLDFAWCPPSAKVITRESLLAAQEDDLRRIMDLLSLKGHHARTLLIHYRWDVEKVIAVFVENGKDKLYAAAGLKVVEHDNLIKLSSILTCNICFEDLSANMMTVMDCGHYFCNDCWTEHFIVNISEGKSRRIRCMTHKCNAVCDEAKVRQLVSARDPGLSEKFDRFLLESYIEDNKSVKWCPSVPHCGNAIQVKDDKFCEVECPCGLQFCFSCSSEAHSPCTCLMWEHWRKKCVIESENLSWITTNTKPCPSCLKPVLKDGGCNHVTCSCGQSFCWLCGGATGKEHSYTSISGHSCGRYKAGIELEAHLAKQYVERFVHYHSRYKAHEDSFMRESKLKGKVELKISMLEENLSTKDFDWVVNGLYRLFRSRHVLAYSYAFAYYMFGDDLFKGEMSEEERMMKQYLFEDQQQQFEAHVEKLSSFLEKFDSLSEDEVLSSRMSMFALSATTDNLCRNMYEYIETDLLGSLGTLHHIAPYKSSGVEKASFD